MSHYNASYYQFQTHQHQHGLCWKSVKMLQLMYILLTAHIIRNNVVLMKEQESLKGIVGWSVLLHKFVNGMEWEKPFDGSYYPTHR